MRCSSAQLLNIAALPIDSDDAGVEVLRGLPLEDGANVDLVLSGSSDGLPGLHTGQDVWGSSNTVAPCLRAALRQPEMVPEGVYSKDMP